MSLACHPEAIVCDNDRKDLAAYLDHGDTVDIVGAYQAGGHTLADVAAAVDSYHPYQLVAGPYDRQADDLTSFPAYVHHHSLDALVVAGDEDAAAGAVDVIVESQHRAEVVEDCHLVILTFVVVHS